MSAMKEILTEKLLLHELHENDHEFIFKLVNSPGWLEFIGDRNIRTLEDATIYTLFIIRRDYTRVGISKHF